MKIQVSRDGFRRDHRYSGVYQQQGRMITDADWNEMVAIAAEALRSRIGDIVGSGGPADDGVVDDDRRLRAGTAYAGGVRAQLCSQPGATGHVYDCQADFPDRPPRPGGGHQLYLDVWERTVTSLADHGLVDPALHGADTTSRTQTMAQLKWAPLGVDVTDGHANPQVGNGVLTAALRHGGALTETDPCDPCAQEIVVDTTATGNYLFRLEVHDVGRGESGLSRIVLKWSSENGAEDFEWSSRPPSFVAPGWAYEVYDETAEKHLGVHLVGDDDFAPKRGSLSAEAPTLAAGEDTWVRRWDGFCQLTRHGTEWRLETSGSHPGVDRGVLLSPQNPLGASHGNVKITPGASYPQIELNLVSLKLSLDLNGGHVVPGDYWQVLVRERGEPQVSVLSAEPVGVVHHYLLLGQEDSTGVLDLDPQRFRQLRFPQLTDLNASDIGFDGRCDNDLFDDTATVDQALKALCGLAAQHVAYSAPEDCASGVVGTPATVQDALDALCGLGAGHVAYTAPEGCASGVVGTPATVQDALDALCGLAAEHVAFDPQSDYLTERRVTNVDEALEALADREAQNFALRGALVALFGRGVLRGLVPRMTVSASGTRLLLELTVTEGTVLSGRGELLHLPELRYSTMLDIPTSGGLRVLPGHVLGEHLVALREETVSPLTSMRFEATERAVLSDETIESVRREIADTEFSGLDDLRSRIIEMSDIPTVELADEIVESVITLDLASFTPVERSLWLYLRLPEDGQPTLLLRGSRPGPILQTGAAIRAGVESPQSTPTVDAAVSCARAHEQAWAYYGALSVPEKNTDGEVCLARLGTFGSAAWISPDDREQLAVTPALQNGLWRARLNPVYDDMKEACTRISSITPAQGRQGEQVTALIIGNAMSGTTGVTFSGSGVTAQVTSVGAGGQSVQVNISNAASAPLGPRTFTVQTPGGSISSGSVTFTVLGAVGITGISPSTLRQGTSTSVTITGAGLSEAKSVGFGARISSTVVSASEHSVTVNVVVEPDAPLEPRAFTVNSPGGTFSSGSLRLAVSPWVRATSLSPTSAEQFALPVEARITGSNLQGATAVSFTGNGVTAQVLSSSQTDVSARVTVAADAETTKRVVSVQTPAGMAESALGFAVLPMSSIWTLRPSGILWQPAGRLGTSIWTASLSYRINRDAVPPGVVRFALSDLSDRRTLNLWISEIGLDGDRGYVDVQVSALPGALTFAAAGKSHREDLRDLAGGTSVAFDWAVHESMPL